MFTITILDRVLTYEVDRTMVTQPEDQSELFVKRGEDLVTLYTCYPYGVNTHRLLVRGHRIPTPEKETPGVTMLQLATEQWYGKGILAAAALLLLIILLVFRKKKKKQRKAGEKRETKTEAPEISGREDSEKREGDGG